MSGGINLSLHGSEIKAAINDVINGKKAEW